MRPVRLITSIGLLLAALVVGAAKWKTLVVALLSSASYFADFPFWPLWLPLGGLTLGYLVFYLAGVAFRFEINSKHDVMVAALFAAVLVARFSSVAWPVGGEADGRTQDAPRLLMARAASRLKSALDRNTSDSSSRTYPIDPQELEELLRENKRLPPSGYRSHGVQAPVRLVVFCGANGPVLEARSEDRAGTIYYAVNEDASRYWISMVGLSDLPAGKSGIISTAGQPVVLVPESRLQTDEE